MSEERRGPLGIIIGVLAGVLVFLVAVLAIVLSARSDDDGLAGQPETTASPTSPAGTAAPTPNPTPTATTTPTPTPTATPTPTPRTTPTDREPTDADAAAFSTSYEPPGATDAQAVTVDANADGRPEVVVVSLAGGLTRLDVAAWDGQAYEVVFTDQGGPAQRLEDFTVTDVNDDDVPEIVTRQATGSEGASLSLWAWNGEEFARQSAVGGCWDGSHTYGIVGVDLARGQIAATCDASPLPAAAWPSDVYEWDSDAWTYARTREPS